MRTKRTVIDCNTSISNKEIIYTRMGELEVFITKTSFIYFAMTCIILTKQLQINRVNFTYYEL